MVKYTVKYNSRKKWCMDHLPVFHLRSLKPMDHLFSNSLEVTKVVCTLVVWTSAQQIPKIIHFGAGEGYYVMGLQNFCCPQKGVQLFWMWPETNIVLLKQNLEANGMTAVVTIFDHKVNAVNAAANVEGNGVWSFAILKGKMVIFTNKI